MFQKLKPYKTLLIILSLVFGIALLAVGAYYILKLKQPISQSELSFYDADGSIVRCEIKPNWFVFLQENCSQSEGQKILSNYKSSATFTLSNSLNDFFTFCENEYPAITYQTIFNEQIVSLSADDSNASIKKAVLFIAEKLLMRCSEVIKGRLTKVGFENAEIIYNQQKQSIRIVAGPVKRVDEFKNFITRPAQLNFWETYTNHEIENAFISADSALRQHLFPEEANASKELFDNTSDTMSLQSLASEGSLAETTEEAQWAAARNKNPLRVYLMGGFEPKFNANIPIHDARISYVAWKDTAELRKYLEMETVKNKFPKDIQFYFGDADDEIKKLKMSILYGIRSVFNGNKALISGEQIETAAVDFDPINGSPAIMITMNRYGAKVWERMTEKNIGHPIAMVLDGKVLSAPMPTEKIMGGRSNISGLFSINEAYELATLLNLGALPLSLYIEEESGK
ncbi:MAG: hypothetical protein IPI46_11870 [Bacteroidetes bacterium]|nr:hypothetical protein [Bacteroidota bacterium]